jgi:hypothetical protein
MAFITKNPNGKGFLVRNGVSGEILTVHKDKKDAEMRQAALHKKHKPSKSARGKSAQKKITKRLKTDKKKLPKSKFSPKQPKGKKAGVHRKKK